MSLVTLALALPAVLGLPAGQTSNRVSGSVAATTPTQDTEPRAQQPLVFQHPIGIATNDAQPQSDDAAAAAETGPVPKLTLLGRDALVPTPKKSSHGNSTDSAATTPTTMTAATTAPWRSNRQIRAVVDDPDDPERWTDMSYPYSAMGRLVFEDATDDADASSRRWCTGTLVGPRHVATARHCIPSALWSSTSENSGSVRFEPQLGNVQTAWVTEILALDYAVEAAAAAATASSSEAKKSKGVKEGASTSADACQDQEQRREDDWAIYILDQPLGDRYGWLGTKTPSDAPVVEEPAGELRRAASNSYYQYGYSASTVESTSPVPFRQEDVSLLLSASTDALGLCEGPLYHNAYASTDAATDGQSGGALFTGPDMRGEFYEVGVLSSVSVDDTSNGHDYGVSAGGEAWVRAVMKARAEYV